MKTFLLTVSLWALCFCGVQAQDKIIKYDGHEIMAKVLEIDANMVKYRKEDDHSGPIRSINGDHIFMIIYENGKREYFEPHQGLSEKKSSGVNPATLPPIETPDYALLPNIVPPPVGHASVYFIRPSVVGFALPFGVYKDDRVISLLKVKNYERHLSPAGTYRFFSSNFSAESFLIAHLQAGGVYFLRLNAMNGEIEPIDAHHKEFRSCMKLVAEKNPYTSKDEDLTKHATTYSRVIDGKKKRLDGLIQHGMTSEITVLEAEMAIPYEILRK